MRTMLLAMVVTGTALLPGSGVAETHDIVVFFTEWSARIDQPADDIIRQAAEQASEVGAGTITVTGFADTTGSTRASSLLSATRAQVVVDRLVDDGIDPLRIQLASRGGTGFVQSPLESHRASIVISPGADINVIPDRLRLAMPARVDPAGP